MPYYGKTLIGLTGNIACGKSTVLRQLARLGAYTIDADKLIHQILLKGGPAYEPVLEEFGEGILGEDGEIDRRSLARIVFSDPEKLRRELKLRGDNAATLLLTRINARCVAILANRI